MSQVYEVGGIYLKRSADGTFRLAEDGWSTALPLDLDDHDALKAVVQLIAPRLALLLHEDHFRWTEGFIKRQHEIVQLDRSRRRQKSRKNGQAKAVAVNKIKAAKTDQAAIRIYSKAFLETGGDRDRSLDIVEDKLRSLSRKSKVIRAWSRAKIAKHV
ncbi:hypothetical protein [Ruegeria sp. HKCCD7318]|uniref:hypothetical protein n=1 Tax=Ruegeria sp. HKCCD7318 TaxID=2683014 RepID=UPI0014920B8B|nr:hypothetical protein [Ruegeria sp. HKCCD7318]NOE33870.1 hypothetical protein [Ruegeria sp. HKCCD7318]